MPNDCYNWLLLEGEHACVEAAVRDVTPLHPRGSEVISFETRLPPPADGADSMWLKDHWCADRGAYASSERPYPLGETGTRTGRAFEFTTAWAPPGTWLFALSAAHPDVRLSHAWEIFVDGQHVLLADDDEGFAQACVTLLTQHGLRSQLVDAAHSLFLDSYQWSVAQNRLESVARETARPDRDRADQPGHSLRNMPGYASPPALPHEPMSDRGALRMNMGWSTHQVRDG